MLHKTAMHYVIGDVHGEYQTLLALYKQIGMPKNLFFVGDLTDRGPESNKVINFIRKNGFRCTIGNHDVMMMVYGTMFLETYPKSINEKKIHYWLKNGGDETLISYGLIKKHNGELVCNLDKPSLEDFKDDIKWIKTLPAYIKIKKLTINKKEVVISHSNITSFYKLIKKNSYGDDGISYYQLNNRTKPKIDSDIYNIFGHTPLFEKVNVSSHYINIDTGCCFRKYSEAKLSCFCIETQEVLSVKTIGKYNLQNSIDKQFYNLKFILNDKMFKVNMLYKYITRENSIFYITDEVQKKKLRNLLKEKSTLFIKKTNKADDLYFLYKIGQVFINLSLFDDAIRCFKILLKSDFRTDDISYYYLAKAYEKYGFYADAISYYNKALEVNPNLNKAITRLKKTQKLYKQ